MNELPENQIKQLELETIRAAYYQALKEKEQVSSKMRAREAQLKEEALRVIQVEFNDLYNMVTTKTATALRAMNEVEGEINRLDSLKNMPYPEGTILCRWQTVGFSSLYRLTDIKAVIQVFKDGDAYAGKQACPPNIGDIVFRFLNKDGKLGKKLEICYKGSSYGTIISTDHENWRESITQYWLPEGVIHPKAGEPWKI